MNPQPEKRADKMKYPEELNLQKETDCGAGAERTRPWRKELDTHAERRRKGRQNGGPNCVL